MTIVPSDKVLCPKNFRIISVVLNYPFVELTFSLTPFSKDLSIPVTLEYNISDEVP